MYLPKTEVVGYHPLAPPPISVPTALHRCCCGLVILAPNLTSFSIWLTVQSLAAVVSFIPSQYLLYLLLGPLEPGGQGAGGARLFPPPPYYGRYRSKTFSFKSPWNTNFPDPLIFWHSYGPDLLGLSQEFIFHCTWENDSQETMSNVITQLLSRHRTGKWLRPRTYKL